MDRFLDLLARTAFVTFSFLLSLFVSPLSGLSIPSPFTARF